MLPSAATLYGYVLYDILEKVVFDVMPRLKMLRGPEPGTEITLTEEVVTVGRGRRNDIIIQDNEVSRSHCRLVRVLDDYEIQDLNSTNGTFVNGQPVDENGWLLSGRLIVELGDSITFEYVPEDLASGTDAPVSEALQSVGGVLYLVIVQATQSQPEIYALDRAKVSIGRDIDNDIVLYEPEASRHHINMVLTSDGYTIEDLNTMNGTFVNEHRLREQRTLQPKDKIKIGKKIEMWYTDDLEHTLRVIRTEALEVDTQSGLTEKITKQTLEVKTPDEQAVPDSVTPEKETDEMPDIQQALQAAGHDGAPPDAEPSSPEETPSDTQPEPPPHVGHGLEPDQLEKAVFLAHARSDWDKIAMQIFAYLQDNNVQVWTDQYLTPESDDWREAFDQALAESLCVLAIISEDSLQETHVKRAIQHFQAREKPILLVQYGDIEQLPLMIQNVPAVEYNPAEPQRALRTIHAEIRRLLIQQSE